jgi:hypothetical protein
MKKKQLLNNIQDRVSNVVLRQIDSQLEKMEKELVLTVLNKITIQCRIKTNTNEKKSVFLYREPNENGKYIDFYSNFYKTNLFIG